MRSRLPLVPALVALLCGCGPRWGEIESKESGSRVYMPTPTKRIDAALTDENGTFHYLGYGREARSAFAIPGFGFIPLSDPVVEATSLDLRKIAPHLRRDADARVLDMPEAAHLPYGPNRYKPFEVSACRGLELHIPGDLTHVRRRACIVGDHLYRLSVIGSEDEVFGRKAGRFFDSLEILPTHHRREPSDQTAAPGTS